MLMRSERLHPVVFRREQDYQNQHCRQKQPVMLGETGVLTSLGAAGSLLPKHPCQEVLFLDESTKALLFIFFSPHFWLQKKSAGSQDS